MMLRKRLVGLFVLGCLTAVAFGQTAPLSIPEYRTRLHDYQLRVEHLSQTPQDASAFYQELPQTLTVQTGSANAVASLDFLRNGLNRFLRLNPAAKRQIITGLSARLLAMQEEADRFAQPSRADQAARDRLTKILAASEFRRVHGPTEWEILQQRLYAWFDRLLRRLFPKNPDLAQAGQWFVWIMIAIASSIFAVWLYRLSRDRLPQQPREILPFLPSARSWRAWLAEARENAARGQWRDAIHFGFWAAVSRLESENVWRPDKARTPREYLQAIPPSSDVKEPFTAVSRKFEATWYGGRPASATDFEQFVGELEKLGCRG